MKSIAFPRVGAEPPGGPAALTKFAWLSIAAAVATIALRLLWCLLGTAMTGAPHGGRQDRLDGCPTGTTSAPVPPRQEARHTCTVVRATHE